MRVSATTKVRPISRPLRGRGPIGLGRCSQAGLCERGPAKSRSVMADPFTTDPFTTDPFTTDPFTTDPFTTDPVTTYPLATDRLADPERTNDIATEIDFF